MSAIKRIAGWGVPFGSFTGRKCPSVWGVNAWAKPWEFIQLSIDYGAIPGYLINVYDRTGAHIASISDSSPSGLQSIKWSYTENGCGDLEIKHKFAEVLNPAGTAYVKLFDIGYRVEIFIISNQEPWYNGFITEMPEKTGADYDVYTIRGKGYFERLKWRRITHHFTSRKAHYIADYIAKNYIEPYIPDIVYLQCNISTDASYVVNDINFNRTTADLAFKQLAILAGNYDYGVNQRREIFFRPKSDDINLRLWLGEHFTDFDYTKSGSKLLNCLYVKCGKISGSGSEQDNYVGEPIEDTASQTVYGLYEDEQTAPNFMDVDDAKRWGYYQVETYKNPQEQVKIGELFNFSHDAPILAEGQAQVTLGESTKTGTPAMPTVLTLPIKKTTYTIDGQNKLKCEIEIGSLQPYYDTGLKKWAEDMDKQELLLGMNLTQL